MTDSVRLHQEYSCTSSAELQLRVAVGASSSSDATVTSNVAGVAEAQKKLERFAGCYGPARRATAIDPIQALRME